MNIPPQNREGDVLWHKYNGKTTKNAKKNFVLLIKEWEL
jgi:hypothetical protein